MQHLSTCTLQAQLRVRLVVGVAVLGCMSSGFLAYTYRQEAAPGQDQSHNQPHLRSFQHIDPPMTQYSYAPLPELPGTVRLFHPLRSYDDSALIHGELVEYSLTAKRKTTHPYEALSYV